METISSEYMNDDEYWEKIKADRKAGEEIRIINEMNDRLVRCGFPQRLASSSLKSFETPDVLRASCLERVISYANLFKSASILPASCMLICGRPGTGKTHMAVGIARRAAVAFGVRYATVSGLARDVRSSYSKLAEKTEKEILDEHVNPSLLVLDEVGVGLGTDHERAMMHDVLAGRYDRRRPTIMISNLSLEDFKSTLGERIVDRIREDNGIVIECKWESWRGRKAV